MAFGSAPSPFQGKKQVVLPLAEEQEVLPLQATQQLPFQATQQHVLDAVAASQPGPGDPVELEQDHHPIQVDSEDNLAAPLEDVSDTVEDTLTMPDEFFRVALQSALHEAQIPTHCQEADSSVEVKKVTDSSPVVQPTDGPKQHAFCSRNVQPSDHAEECHGFSKNHFGFFKLGVFVQSLTTPSFQMVFHSGLGYDMGVPSFKITNFNVKCELQLLHTWMLL